MIQFSILLLIVWFNVDAATNVEKIQSPKTVSSDDLKSEKVDLAVYYECMCPHCRHFFKDQLQPLLEKLGHYVNLVIHPYGRAKTYEKNGHYEFSCPHGPSECYGNKLHACAMDTFQNVTKSVIFDSCLMDYSQQGNGSDDKAADVCSKLLNLDTKSIHDCARNDEGSLLLKQHGEETAKRSDLKHVPYILIDNNWVDDVKDLKHEICQKFKKPPAECNNKDRPA